MEITDYFDMVFKSVGTVGGLIAAFRAVSEMKLNRIVRERDLRWKQAGSAKQLIDEMFEHPGAKDASLMFDWDIRDYDIDGQIETIKINHVIKALRTTNTVFTEKETYIRDCMDYFFYYVQLMEQSLVNKVFEEKDIRFPMEYYARLIKEKEIDKALNDFLREYHYDDSIAFLKRFKL